MQNQVTHLNKDIEYGSKEKKKEKIWFFDEKIPGQNATEAGNAIYGSYTGFCCSYRQDYLDQCHKGQQVHEDRAGSAEL